MAHDDDAKMEALWEITLNGFEDESIGSADDLGWFTVVTDDDGARFIVSQDGNGFRHYEAYTEERWQGIVATYNEHWFGADRNSED